MEPDIQRPKDNPHRLGKTPEERYRDDMLTIAYMTSTKFGSGVDVTGSKPKESQEPEQPKQVVNQEDLTTEIVVQQTPLQEPQQAPVNSMQSIAEEFLPSLQASKEFTEGPPPQINVPYDIPEEVSVGTGFSPESAGLQSNVSETLQPTLSVAQLPEPTIGKLDFFDESSLFVAMQPPSIVQQESPPKNLATNSIQEFEAPLETSAPLTAPSQQTPTSFRPLEVNDVLVGVQELDVPEVSLPQFTGSPQETISPNFSTRDVSQQIPGVAQKEFEIPESPSIDFKNPYAFIDGPEVTVNPAYRPDDFEKDMSSFPDREMHRESLDDLQDATRDYLRGVDTVLNSIVEELREARSRLTEIETALDRRYSR